MVDGAGRIIQAVGQDDQIRLKGQGLIQENHFLKSLGLSARISASFGIASYPDHALTPEALIQKADQAMYRVKEREKNGIEVAV